MTFSNTNYYFLIFCFDFWEKTAQPNLIIDLFKIVPFLFEAPENTKNLTKGVSLSRSADNHCMPTHNPLEEYHWLIRHSCLMLQTIVWDTLLFITGFLYLNTKYFNHCLCLPKAELNTKNETKRPLVNGCLVRFLVFNSITHVVKNNGMKRGPFRALHSFLRQMEHILMVMSNLVEHQKRNQPAFERWPVGFVFGVQHGPYAVSWTD